MSMVIETINDSRMLFKKTGRIRFRNDRKGRVILQVEYEDIDRDMDAILRFRDATISDIQWREEHE